MKQILYRLDFVFRPCIPQDEGRRVVLQPRIEIHSLWSERCRKLSLQKVFFSLTFCYEDFMQFSLSSPVCIQQWNCATYLNHGLHIIVLSCLFSRARPRLMSKVTRSMFVVTVIARHDTNIISMYDGSLLGHKFELSGVLIGSQRSRWKTMQIFYAGGDSVHKDIRNSHQLYANKGKLVAHCFYGSWVRAHCSVYNGCYIWCIPQSW